MVYATNSGTHPWVESGLLSLFGCGAEMMLSKAVPKIVTMNWASTSLDAFYIFVSTITINAKYQELQGCFHSATPLISQIITLWKMLIAIRNLRHCF